METDPAKRSEPTRAEDVVMRLSERLAITASARTVYGEPVHAYERTIIPVAKFGYGLGATSGGRNGENVGGGGGGVGAKPAGYIEITDQGTRYVAISRRPAPGCRGCWNRSRLSARAIKPIGENRVKPPLLGESAASCCK
jgi:Sporulation protein YtfJ (Spore_YtfJ)